MPVTAVRDEGALRMWVCRLPVHIGPAVCTVFRKSPANPWLPKGPTESSAPTTTLALSCRGGRLCPPADRTGFYGNLRRIRGCPAGRCGHRPLHDSGKFVLPRKFRMQGGEDGAVGDMTSPQICTTPPPDKTAPFRSNGAVHAHMGGGSYSAEMR